MKPSISALVLHISYQLDRSQAEHNKLIPVKHRPPPNNWMNFLDAPCETCKILGDLLLSVMLKEKL